MTSHGLLSSSQDPLKCLFGGGGCGPCDFSVSSWSKSFFFPFWGTFIQLGGLLGQGLELGLGPGLDNKVSHPMSTFSIGFIVLDKHLIQGLSRPTARMLYYFEVFTRWSIFCLDSWKTLCGTGRRHWTLGSSSACRVPWGCWAGGCWSPSCAPRTPRCCHCTTPGRSSGRTAARRSGSGQPLAAPGESSCHSRRRLWRPPSARCCLQCSPQELF